MSSEDVPAHQESTFIYQDKANILTMLSGGVVFAILMYFITGFFLSAFNFQSRLIQFIMAGFVILLSLRMGSSPGTTIKIDTKTGYIEASDKEYTYKGYVHEPEMFLVLQKENTLPNGRKIIDYKLTLKVDEETTYEVPIDNSQEAAKAIRRIEAAKEAIPLGN